MSYILDALKKSDQKRKLGMVPGLQTDHAAVVNIKKKRRLAPLLFVLVGVGLLINVVLWLWWAKPWQGEMQPQATRTLVAPVSQPKATVARTNESAQPSALPWSEEHPRVGENLAAPPDPVAPATQVPVVVEPPPVRQLEPEESQPLVLTYPEEPLGQSEAPDEPVVVAEEAVATSVAGGQGTTVMTQAELPGPIQAALPQISISLHFYSNKPGVRLVRINDRHLHEGDMVANDLRLQEITESGVILSFRGYNFQVDKL